MKHSIPQPLVFHPAIEAEWRQDYSRNHQYITHDYLVEAQDYLVDTKSPSEFIKAVPTAAYLCWQCISRKWKAMFK